MHLYKKLATILPLATLLISAVLGAFGHPVYLYPVIAVLELIIFIIFIWLWTNPLRYGLAGGALMLGGNFAAARLAEICATPNAVISAELIGILIFFITFKIWVIYAIYKYMADAFKSEPDSKP